MKIKEIITRKTGLEVTVDEMIFVVESYIKERKQSIVDINLLSGMNQNDPFFDVKYARQLQLLNKAFNEASEWYLK